MASMILTVTTQHQQDPFSLVTLTITGDALVLSTIEGHVSTFTPFWPEFQQAFFDPAIVDWQQHLERNGYVSEARLTPLDGTTFQHVVGLMLFCSAWPLWDVVAPKVCYHSPYLDLNWIKQLTRDTHLVKVSSQTRPHWTIYVVSDLASLTPIQQHVITTSTSTLDITQSSHGGAGQEHWKGYYWFDIHLHLFHGTAQTRLVLGQLQDQAKASLTVPR